MNQQEEIERIIEELENCFLGHDEYILGLLAELKNLINQNPSTEGIRKRNNG